MSRDGKVNLLIFIQQKINIRNQITAGRKMVVVKNLQNKIRNTLQATQTS